MGKKFAENANQGILHLRNMRTSSTELRQLTAHELISLLTKSNPAFLSARTIAVELDCALSTVYRLGENPKQDGIKITLDDLIKFARITKSTEIIVKYIRARCEEQHG